MIGLAQELAGTVGVKPACTALSIVRSSFYRETAVAASTEMDACVMAPQTAAPTERRRHPRALSDEQRESIRDTFASDRFIDCSPAHVKAALLDEGVYLGSERTMYRVLGADAPLVERRRQQRHPKYAAPELVATKPNEVWSWDITRLKGPSSRVAYRLYAILDIFSRCCVGWGVFDRESEQHAKLLIQTTCERQQIVAGQLSMHADRGGPMRSLSVSELYAALGIDQSHSRPYCSNDNPYIESYFKTLKYSPAFPERFGSIEDARVFCRLFFEWYNNVHRHSGIAMLTPASVHMGTAEAIIQRRDDVLAEAYRTHPERFVKGQPQARRVPEAAWINQPKGLVVPSGAAVD